MTVYGVDPFPRSEPHNFECLAGEEVEDENDHANSASSQDRPSQDEELIEINQAQIIFLRESMSVKLR